MSAVESAPPGEGPEVVDEAPGGHVVGAARVRVPPDEGLRRQQQVGGHRDRISGPRDWQEQPERMRISLHAGGEGRPRKWGHGARRTERTLPSCASMTTR